MSQILIKDKEALRKKIATIQKDGAETIQVVSDFDKTLTKAFFEGKKIMSSYAILREHDYLGEAYAKKAFALFDTYHPYELAVDLSFEERKQKMDEWWDEHLALMIKSGISKDIFVDIAEKDYVHLRKGIEEFCSLLEKNNIPLLIFSAGLGDIIKNVLVKKNLLKDNTKIIANFFTFNEEGKVSGYNHDIVHVFNKNTISHNEDIPHRHNVILLGDNIDDLGMVEAVSYDSIITIGFLNAKVEERKEMYIEKFDVVILGDGSLDAVNDLLKDILKTN